MLHAARQLTSALSLTFRKIPAFAHSINMNTTRNPVGWFEIYVQDMNRARAFYEATFDTKLEKLPSPGMTMLAFPMKPELPGCAGALVK